MEEEIEPTMPDEIPAEHVSADVSVLYLSSMSSRHTQFAASSETTDGDDCSFATAKTRVTTGKVHVAPSLPPPLNDQATSSLQQIQQPCAGSVSHFSQSRSGEVNGQPADSSPIPQGSAVTTELSTLRNCIVDIRRQIGPEKMEFWKDNIEHQLWALLRNLKLPGCSVELVFAARRRKFLPRPYSFKESILVNVTDVYNRKRVEKRIKKLGWPEEHLREGGFHDIFVEVDPVCLTWVHSSHEGGIVSITDLRIGIPPASATWCGQSVMEATNTLGPRKLATIGGMITLDEEFYLLMAGHSFFPTGRTFNEPLSTLDFDVCKEPSEASESEEEEDDTDVEFFPEDVAAENDCPDGNVCFDVSPVHDPQEEGGGRPRAQYYVSTSEFDGGVTSSTFLPDLSLQETERAGSTSRDCDWALIKLPSDAYIRPNKYRDPHTLQQNKISGSSAISLSPLGNVDIIIRTDVAIKGYLNPNPARFAVGSHIFPVQTVSVTQPLSTSGSWVVQGGLVCGHIIGARQQGNIGLMIPISAILNDIVSRTGAIDVCIPSPRDLYRRGLGSFDDDGTTPSTGLEVDARCGEGQWAAANGSAFSSSHRHPYEDCDSTAPPIPPPSVCERTGEVPIRDTDLNAEETDVIPADVETSHPAVCGWLTAISSSLADFATLWRFFHWQRITHAISDIVATLQPCTKPQVSQLDLEATPWEIEPPPSSSIGLPRSPLQTTHARLDVYQPPAAIVGEENPPRISTAPKEALGPIMRSTTEDRSLTYASDAEISHAEPRRTSTHSSPSKAGSASVDMGSKRPGPTSAGLLEYDDEGDVFVDSEDEDDRHCWTVAMQIQVPNGPDGLKTKQCLAIIDSGSSCCIASRQVIKRMGVEGNIWSETHIIKTVQKEVLTTTGVIALRFNLRGKPKPVYWTKFLVLDEGEPGFNFILGRNWISKCPKGITRNFGEVPDIWSSA
ncbi:hypothetical protein H2202_010169 [Exophiala xenobiotica]|nr:hypothetical protein H2202_010169 [Exophiala xenobiotica]